MKKFVAILAIFSALFLGAIDLKTASKSDLMQIKGIGEKKADAIIEYRKSNTINSADDLKNIKGFGDTIIDNIKKDIKVKSNTSKKDEKPKSDDIKDSKKAKNSKSDN
ncbi:ComEA family DNA-binding protein [Aliarcobacter cryaerophilus]|uniref:ComEA family DNA-binding protein n=1 Tax=Aliarcobacter cryaerophilus TaxID=28198 RepID=UPI00112F6D5A|nr:helix-hairpin-helix domain-containing protein [Aliarcobacter cryaerophilus]